MCMWKKGRKEKAFCTSCRAKNNDYLYSYLTGDRALDRNTVDYFVRFGLNYEERSHHNIVFKGNDVQGKTRFASMRGCLIGKGNPLNVTGNDKNYGFNIWYGHSDEVMVFEAAIDLMSYVEIM